MQLLVISSFGRVHDLPYPASLKNELGDWFQRWCDAPVHSVPTNLLDALKQCDRDIYPCIHQLLVIGCTLPVTSCEAERSFSSVRLTMNHLRSPPQGCGDLSK